MRIKNFYLRKNILKVNGNRRKELIKVESLLLTCQVIAGSI